VYSGKCQAGQSGGGLYSLYTILGLEDNAPETAVEEAYRSLRQRLDSRKFEQGSLADRQARQCLLSIENAFRTLTNQTARAKYLEEWQRSREQEFSGELQPKLGQLCVAAGMITLEDLEQAIETQAKLDLPIGQILQEQQLITQAELDGLLLGQQLISLPGDLPHKTGQRLIALGLVTEDMVRIALIEQRTFNRKLEDLLTAHGWLDPAILKILLEPADTVVQ